MKMYAWPPPIVMKDAVSAATLAANDMEIYEDESGAAIAVRSKDELPLKDEGEWKFAGKSQDLR